MVNKTLIVICLVVVYVDYAQLTSRISDENSGKLFIQTDLLQIKDNCPTVNFHYLIISDESYTPVSRQIQVFLDEKAFSEQNLTTLFSHLAKKYFDTKKLIIVVKTNWNQIPLPSECPPVGISDISTKPESFEYHQARYFRDDKVEYFTYNPILKTEAFKKIILKGKDSKP